MTARPPLAHRRFHSAPLEAAITQVQASITDPVLARLFANSLPHTLDTAVYITPGTRPLTFVMTGDIPAMWLRDATAQVWPYLRFANADAALQQLLVGVLNQQVDCLLIDPWANAFERVPGASPWSDDATQMHPLVHERKWELDSPCAVLRLSHGYWQATGDLKPFDGRWRAAMQAVLQVLRERQQGSGPYRFQRRAANPLDSLPFGGEGWPALPGTGLIASAFRPSDDACTFPLHIPSNFLAAVSLRQLAEVATAVDDLDLATEALDIATTVQRALDTLPTPWPYEIDGFGSQLCIDDANVPSLLSLPYLGACWADDPRYQATRAQILNPVRNPFFIEGRAVRGIGSPHTGLRRIWPMALTMQALTSTSEAEIRACLRSLCQTHAGTGLMHEAFDADDPTQFSRPWFAWANSLFGELILTVHQQRPELLKELHSCPP